MTDKEIKRNAFGDLGYEEDNHPSGNFRCIYKCWGPPEHDLIFTQGLGINERPMKPTCPKKHNPDMVNFWQMFMAVEKPKGEV